MAASAPVIAMFVAVGNLVELRMYRELVLILAAMITVHGKRQSYSLER